LIGWMGPRTRLDAAEKRNIPAFAGNWTPDRPARSLSLYQLSCQHIATWRLKAGIADLEKVHIPRQRPVNTFPRQP
jgi:hypothetical protein